MKPQNHVSILIKDKVSSTKVHTSTPGIYWEVTSTSISLSLVGDGGLTSSIIKTTNRRGKSCYKLDDGIADTYEPVLSDRTSLPTFLF